MDDEMVSEHKMKAGSDLVPVDELKSNMSHHSSTLYQQSSDMNLIRLLPTFFIVKPSCMTMDTE
jgi:hypothetical protein